MDEPTDTTGANGGAPRAPASTPEALSAHGAEIPFEVRASGIEGRGAFASRPIVSGEVVVEYVGERLRKADSQIRQDAGNPFIFIVDDDTDIDGDVPYNPARFLNHSCDPNCDAYLDEGRIWITARRDIAVGEELTFNYGYDFSEYQDYPCRCGTANCVGFIVAEEHFPEVRRRHGRPGDAGATNLEPAAATTGGSQTPDTDTQPAVDRPS